MNALVLINRVTHVTRIRLVVLVRFSQPFLVTVDPGWLINMVECLTVSCDNRRIGMLSGAKWKDW